MKSNWIGLRGDGSEGYLGAFALNLSMSTVSARKRQREREQLLWGVRRACFFLCCGALFLHLTLRCDGDDDGDSDVFIAKNICAARHEEP